MNHLKIRIVISALIVAYLIHLVDGAPTSLTIPENDCTFGVALHKNQTNPAAPFLEDVIYDNRLAALNTVTNQCRMYSDNSFNFVEICVGVAASRDIQLQSLGAYPSPLGFDWLSTSHNGLETGCRSGALRLNVGVSFKLNTARGVIESPDKQAGWSSFSISNSMKYFSDFFSGYSMDSLIGYNTVVFSNIHANPPNQNFNSAEQQYSCLVGGFYFFSFSAGVPASTPTMVALDGLDKVYLAQRFSSNTNGLTTISRTVLVPCTTAVKMVVYSGQIVPGNNSTLIHFMAFPYERKNGQSVSWAAYKTSNSNGDAFLSYDSWDITQNITPVNNSVLKISVTGHYYVYVSIGTVPFKQSSVSLRKNDVIVFNVERLSSNFDGIDIIGHGMMIYLQQNDVLRVAVEHNSVISSSDFGLHTSFLGMLIYVDN